MAAIKVFSDRIGFFFEQQWHDNPRCRTGCVSRLLQSALCFVTAGEDGLL
jgi:hypothetical protein